MIEEMIQIARRIKEIREISEISPETMASNIGITPDLYEKYESGSCDIPVGVIIKIAHWFNLELSVLLGGDNPRLHVYGVVRKGKGLNLERRKQYKYENLGYNFIHKKAEPFMVTISPDLNNEPSEFNSHPGQEFNIIIEGDMMINIDGHEIILSEGDSIYFDSGFRHKMKALNDKQVKFLAVVM
jgi:transcriptional regulator with XRE-family HTH domain